jgi:hypothetical protein
MPRGLPPPHPSSEQFPCQHADFPLRTRSSRLVAPRTLSKPLNRDVNPHPRAVSIAAHRAPKVTLERRVGWGICLKLSDPPQLDPLWAEPWRDFFRCRWQVQRRSWMYRDAAGRSCRIRLPRDRTTRNRSNSAVPGRLRLAGGVVPVVLWTKLGHKRRASGPLERLRWHDSCPL